MIKEHMMKEPDESLNLTEPLPVCFSTEASDWPVSSDLPKGSGVTLQRPLLVRRGKVGTASLDS